MQSGCPFDITPYTQSDIVTNPNVFNLNYTNQDFASMKTRLVSYLQQNFDPADNKFQFTDLIESDLAWVLIESWAFLADTLSFKADQIANEVFIDTVVEVANAFRLAQLVGFQPQPPIASVSLWTATINNPLLTDLPVPAPFQVDVTSAAGSFVMELFPADSNNNPIFNQDIIIPAGNLVNASVIGLQGQTYTQNFVGTGSVNQTLTLSYSPVIWDSVQVQVNGATWTQVSYFTASQRRTEYMVIFDSDYNGFVVFGNQLAGQIPSNGAAIQTTYRVGGGTIGNITSGSVQTQTIVSVPGYGYPVPVNFANYTAGQYGYDGDTIDDIRAKLPLWITTQNRAVSGTDYEIIANQFATPYNGQIGKSVAVLRNYGCAANIIDVYVLALNSPNGLQVASDELKTALQSQFYMVQMFTDDVCIKDGFIIQVDITVDVILSSFYAKYQANISDRINRVVNSFFALDNWEFGQVLKDTDLMKALSNIPQVSQFQITFVTSTNPSSDTQVVTPTFNQIIRQDTLDVVFTYQ